jgi:hypothetical protein
LRFSNDGVGRDPREIKLHGPYAGPRNVNVLYVVPKAFHSLIEPFHEILNDVYQELKLGSLNWLSTETIDSRPIGPAYWKAASAVLTKMEKISGPKIIIVILPYKGTQKFDFIKGVISDNTKAKIFQFLLKDTVKAIIDGQKHKSYNIATQIYFKTLSAGKKEALWILLDPAGGVGNTVYSAYDVSRQVNREYDEKTKKVIKERIEAAARASICDCFGLTIRMKSKISPVGEALTTDTVKDIVLSLENDAREALKYFNQDLRRFVLFKDGEIHSNERRIIEKGIEEIRELLPDVSFEAYSVVKSGIERIFSPNGNAPTGFYVELDNTKAILVSSDLSAQKDRMTGEERLLAIPLTIRREVAIPDQNVPLKQILHEFYDLIRLHWQSISFKTKTCLPLKLVQEIGEYSRREIIIPQDIAYPPL